MKYAVDLHIHSALSPCGSNDMTPNNIANMAMLKGLDIVALTDHNACENYPAFAAIAVENGILPIPGMEVETVEEIHTVCLMRNYESLLRLCKYVRDNMNIVQNRPDIFGDQLILDENDELIGSVGQMLITSSNISVDELFAFVLKNGGAPIPAHVDRQSYSMLSNFGFIPDDIHAASIEISKNCEKNLFLKMYSDLKKYRIIKSSDAHYLENISERTEFIELEEKTADALIDKLLSNR